MEDHQFSKQQFMTQQQQLEPAYNDQYVQDLEDEVRMSIPLQMGQSESLSNADSLSRSGRKGDSVVSGNIIHDGQHPRPVFLKKKSGTKTMGLTKQFSSTLQISGPLEQRRIIDQHDQNIVIEDAQEQDQQHYIDYGEPESGIYESSENIIGNNVFEKVGQQVNDSQDQAARSLLREIEAPEAEELETKMVEPPILYQNLDQLLEHPINLDSSNHLLDAILNNLQGLTPEQEAQKRQIEERSRLIQEKMRVTKSAAMPSLATTLNKPEALADAANSSQVKLQLDNLDSNIGQSRLSQPLGSPEEIASKPPKAAPTPQIAEEDDSIQFQLDAQSQPLFPLTPSNEQEEQENKVNIIIESQKRSKANSNYERLLQRHFGRTSSTYGERSKNGQIATNNDVDSRNNVMMMDKRGSGQDVYGNEQEESNCEQEATGQAGSMGMTLREQRDLEREQAQVAGRNGAQQTQSSRMRPKAYMQHTSVSAQKAKALNIDQDQDHLSRGGRERRTKYQRKSPKKLTPEERDEQERLEDRSENLPQEPHTDMKDESAELIGAERGQARGLRGQKYGASMGQQPQQSRSMLMTKSQKDKLYSTQNTGRNPAKASRQKQTASNKLSQSMTYASLSKRAVNQDRLTYGRKGSAPREPRGTTAAAGSGKILVGGSQLVTSKGISGGPHNIDDRMSTRQLRSSRNPSMQDSQAFGQELDLSKTQSVTPGTQMHSSRPLSSRRSNASFQMQFSGNTKPSDATLKIKHQQIQKEIEAAIKQASPDGPSLNIGEFRQSLMNMNYLSAMRDSNKQQFLNTTVAADAESATSLSNQLWTYLNPYNNDKVEKAATFDFLLLLMFNVGHQSERDMAHLLAVQIIQYYKTFDIFLKVDAPLEKVGISDDGDKQEQQQPSIIDEQNLDLTGFQSSLGNSAAAGALSSQLSTKAPSEVQMVDKFLTKRKQAWTLLKLIQAFKQDHGQRFAKIMHDRTSMDRSSSKLTNPLIAGNKSLQKIIPDDTRKYKETAIKQLEKDYTFTPSMNATSRQLAKQNLAKVATERARSRPNQKVKAINSNVDMASNQGQARQHSLKAGEQSMPKDVPFEQMTTEQKVELMQYRTRVAEQRLQTERQLKDSNNLKGCTFVPKTNRTGKQKYLTAKRPGDLQQPKSQMASQGANTKSGAIKQATKPVATQPMYAKKGETKQLQLARQELQARSEQELAECTFQPKIRAYTKKLQHTGADQDPYGEATGQELEQLNRPKGYQEAIERMRKHQELKEKTKLEEERKLKGERYAKDRLGLEKARPPSFLNKPGNSNKRPQLLSIEVSITPTRSGRIGIKEGDDLKVLAANFCKAYQLHKDMQESLVDQLQSHLDSYHQAKEVAKGQENGKLEQQRSVREQRKLMQQQASVSSLAGSSPRRPGDVSTRQPTQATERQLLPLDEGGFMPQHYQQLPPSGQANPDAHGQLQDLTRLNSNYRQLNQDLGLSKIQDLPEESEDEQEPGNTTYLRKVDENEWKHMDKRLQLLTEAAPDNTPPLESMTSQPNQQPESAQPHLSLPDYGLPTPTHGSGHQPGTDIGQEYLGTQSTGSLDRHSPPKPNIDILEQIRQANVAYNNHTNNQNEPSPPKRS